MVCNYGPGGNYGDEPIYEQGEPGTQCPAWTVEIKATFVAQNTKKQLLFQLTFSNQFTCLHNKILLFMIFPTYDYYWYYYVYYPIHELRYVRIFICLNSANVLQTM